MTLQSIDGDFVRVKQGGKEMSLHRWSDNRVLPTLQIELSAANTATASLVECSNIGKASETKAKSLLRWPDAVSSVACF